MHEMSIAVSLVEAAQEELERLGNVRAQAIHLRLGPLSGVVREALEFSYEIACQSTPLEGSSLVIEEVPVLVDCPTCVAPRGIVSLQKFACVDCGSPCGNVIQGRELDVTGLEIVEAGVTQT